MQAVGQFHQVEKVAGDFMHTTEKLSYQALGGKVTVLGIEDLKKSGVTNMPMLTDVVTSNKTSMELPVDVPYIIRLTLQNPSGLADNIVNELPQGSTASCVDAVENRMMQAFSPKVRHPMLVDCEPNIVKSEAMNMVQIFQKRK